MDLTAAGRALVLLGLLIAGLGLALWFGARIPLVGRLPGDLTFGGNGWTVYVPIATSILISVLLTLALTAFAWFGRR